MVIGMLVMWPKEKEFKKSQEQNIKEASDWEKFSCFFHSMKAKHFYIVL